MPRNLPWNRHEPESGAQSGAAPATPARARTTDSTTDTRRSASVMRDIKTERVVRALKSPSTSPPPQPLTETFMDEGPEGDEKYRMVEDELLSMAGRFTAHLHAAEYHRQKQQAKARNADTIDSISRPVVGRMTPGVKAKQDRQAKSRKRRDGLRKAFANGRDRGLDVEDEDEDESPWMGTSLQGLMEEPQGSAVRLSGLTSVEPSTKAARLGLAVRKHESRPSAGPRGGQREARSLADETTDDGDMPAKLSTPRPPQRQSTWPLKSGSKPDEKGPAPRNHGNGPTIVSLSDSDDDLLASLRRRRQESKAPIQKRGKPPEPSNDVIPSFL